MLRRTRWPAGWFVAVVVAQVTVQVAITLARPATSYRLVALDFDASAVGVVAAAFAFVPMLLAVPLGRLTERASAEMVLVGGLVTGFAAVALAAASSLPAFVVATAVLGVGHLAVVVATQSLVARRSPLARRASMFGTMTAAASIGQLIGPLIGGGLVQPTSAAPTSATTAFALQAAGVIALAAVPVVLVLRKRTRGEATPGPVPAPALTIVGVLATPGMRAALAASFASKGTSDLLLTYLPLLGLALGLSAFQVGTLLSLSAATGIAARFATAPLLKRMTARRLVVAMCGLSSAAVGSMPWLEDAWMLAVSMGCLGFMLALVQTISMVWVVSIVPAGSQGGALGVRLATNRVGQVATPALAAGVAGLLGLVAIFPMLSVMLVGTMIVTLASQSLHEGGME